MDLCETPLLVVDGEAEVRWSWECGRVAVTRADLRARLRARLLPDVALASRLEVRLALSNIMRTLATTEAWLLVALERGGRAWVDLVSAMEETLAEAHRMTWYASLTRHSSPEDPRTRTVAAAGRELERTLAAAGLLDPAVEDERLARALSQHDPGDVVLAVGARHALASGIPSWLPAELVFWRALDARLSLAGGSADIELIAFERPLDATREPDAPGRMVDAVAEALDAAPRTRGITPVLGDLGSRGAARAKVELRAADSALAEARAIADCVVEALTAGAAPEQVAIVCPESGGVRQAALRIFADLGIATHEVGGQTRAAGGLLACALEALSVASRSAPRLALAALLRSPYLDARRLAGLSDEREARAAILELARALERTRGVAGRSLPDTLADIVRRSRAANPESLASLAALARRVGESFERALSGSSLGEHAREARRLVHALSLRPILGLDAATRLMSDEAWKGLARAEVGAYFEDVRGKARLDATLEAYETAAARWAPESLTSFEFFRLALEHDLREPVRNEAGPSAGAIRVGALDDVSSRPLALLVLADAHGGLVDHSPSVASLLDAAIRTRLGESIEPALRPAIPASRDADEVRLASAADAARRIVVSYTKRGNDGVLRPPHSLVSSLERQGVPETRWMERLAESSAVTPLAAERAAIEWARERSFGLASRAGADVDAGRGSEETMSPTVQAILTDETGGADRALSVTAIDRFGACAFQGFAAQVLGARTPLVLEDAVSPREDGVLLHGALAAAFDITLELWRARPRDANAIRAAGRAAAAVFLGRDHAPSRRVRAALDDVLERVVRCLEWSLADEEWDFLRAEAGFGKRGDEWEAVTLAGHGAVLRLAGTLDRVDASHDRSRLRVVDYKRSEDGARRLTSHLGESSFQLAIYARAATLGLGKPVVAAMYLPTKQLVPAYRTRGSDAAWARANADDAGLPRFERRALDVIVAARRGELDPRPASPDTCRYCDHDGACRKPRFIIESTADEEAEAPGAMGPSRSSIP